MQRYLAVLATALAVVAPLVPAGPAEAAGGPVAHTDGLPIADLTTVLGMDRTPKGDYDVIGMNSAGTFEYAGKAAAGRAFHASAIQGASAGYDFGAAVTRSPAGHTVDVAVPVSCATPDGGIYVVSKPAAAANFPALTSADRAFSEPACPTMGINPAIDGMVGLSGGRVAVLTETNAGIELPIGVPGHPFTAKKLHAETIESSPQIARDPDTGEVVVAAMGGIIHNGERGAIDYLAWSYRTDNTLHGPTVLPGRIRSGEDRVTSVTAAAGQVWMAIQRNTEPDEVTRSGSFTTPPAGVAVIHRSKHHWGKPYPPSGLGPGRLLLAAVPKTGAVQAVFTGSNAPHGTLHLRRSPNGH